MSTMKPKNTSVVAVQESLTSERPVYERPAVVSYSDEFLLDLLGPARNIYVCSPTDPTCP